jgi:predicted DCC family thiol-disulfide oxidoreductase YuxK
MKRLKVFYDNSCILCHREILHYKSKDEKNLLVLIDISNPKFEAVKYGFDDKEVQIFMHSMDEDGIIYKGLDTFTEIWKRIPSYKKTSSVINFGPLKLPLKLSYFIFAKYIRPNLPKRKCEDESCQTI